MKYQMPRKKTRSDEIVSGGDIRINRDKICDSAIRYNERGAKGRKRSSYTSSWVSTLQGGDRQTREKTGPIIYSTIVVALRTIDHTRGRRDIASAAECTTKAKRREGRGKGVGEMNRVTTGGRLRGLWVWGMDRKARDSGRIAEGASVVVNSSLCHYINTPPVIQLSGSDLTPP